MKLVSIKCPECSANLDVEEGRKHIYCSYCGAEIMLENENEKVYRKIDDARLKEAEVREKVRLKELELEEYKIKKEEKKSKIKIVVVLVAVLVGLLMLLYGGLSKNENISTWGMLVIMWTGLACGFVFLTKHGNKNNKDEQ